VSQARGGIGTAGTVLAVWTASSGLNEMARAVHFIFSEPEKPSPGGWGRRFKAFALLAIWTAAIAAGAVAFILLPMFQGELSRLGAARLLPGAFASTVRYPAGFFALFCAFALTYALVPEKRPSWSRAAQGALLAAGFWSGVSLLFAYLLPRVWHVSLFGGALGSALATLVWAYCGAWGVLLGASWAAREA
jgi:YihY family inner membrane protein